MRRLHGPGSAHLCIDCVLGAAESRASRQHATDKVTQIRKALDAGNEVWFCDQELFVIPPEAAARWVNASIT